METVVRQALSAAGVTFDAVVVDGDTTIIIGAKLKLGNTTLTSSHGGYAGKSLIEKIRDDLDLQFKSQKEFHEGRGERADWQYELGMAEGIAHALGVLRSSSADHEWEEAQKRYETKQKSNQELVLEVETKLPVEEI